MKNHKKQRLLYILFDFLAAAAAWILFFLFRKIQIEPQVFGSDVPISLDATFWAGSWESLWPGSLSTISPGFITIYSADPGWMILSAP
jgi:hypothetical protein